MTRPTTTGKAQDLITFTRSTTGTALAKISYGEELVTNGDFSSDSDWAKQVSANWTISGGKLNGANSTGWIKQNGIVENGKAYKITVDAIVSSGSFRMVTTADGSTYTSYITSSGSYVFYIRPLNALSGGFEFIGNGFTGSIDNISIKEVLYDQPDGTLQLFNHPINKPRIEYDASGNCLGLLMEEARTNLALNSVNASSDNAATNITQVANKANSLTGADDAFLLQANTAGASYTGQLTTVTSGTSYTASRFAKAGASNFAQLSMGTGGFGSAVFANFDLNTGTVSQESNCAAVMTNMGSGWYRCSISKQAVATTFGTSPHYFSAVNSGTANARISEAGNSVYFYGAQTETGAFPSSYIPTSGSAVTRAADLASLAVSEFGYNQDQGSFVVEFDHNDLNDESTQYLLSSTSSSRFIYNNASSQNWQAFDGQSALPFGNVLGNGLPVKLGLGMGSSESSSINNGVIQNTTNATPQDNAGSLLYFGLRYNGANSLNGHVKSIQYYPLRLSNAQLQALTV